MWAKPYFNNVFSAEIQTTSRAESVNSIVKKYLDSKSSIMDIEDLILNIEKRFFFPPKASVCYPLKFYETPIVKLFAEILETKPFER